MEPWARASNQSSALTASVPGPPGAHQLRCERPTAPSGRPSLGFGCVTPASTPGQASRQHGGGVAPTPAGWTTPDADGAG